MEMPFGASSRIGIISGCRGGSSPTMSTMCVLSRNGMKWNEKLKLKYEDLAFLGEKKEI